jgi:hypothetical protein
MKMMLGLLFDEWLALILDRTASATVPTPNALKKSRLFITVIIQQSLKKSKRKKKLPTSRRDRLCLPLTLLSN